MLTWEVHTGFCCLCKWICHQVYRCFTELAVQDLVAEVRTVDIIICSGKYNYSANVFLKSPSVFNILFFFSCFSLPVTEFNFNHSTEKRRCTVCASNEYWDGMYNLWQYWDGMYTVCHILRWEDVQSTERLYCNYPCCM